jgi:hypothetical protein
LHATPCAVSEHPLREADSPTTTTTSTKTQQQQQSQQQQQQSQKSSNAKPSTPAPPAVADDPLSMLLHSDPLALPSMDGVQTPLDVATAEAAASLAAPQRPSSALADAPSTATNGDDSAASSTGATGTPAASPSTMGDTFVPWSSRKADILSKYSTDERIGVTAKFMDDAPNSQVKLPVDQVKQRLDELDDSAEHLQATALALTQQEYISHIEKLHAELILAWDQQERVKSLKIAIQSSKVLGDTSVIRFYPSKFVLITEILDTFGKLVYNRILNRAGAQNDLGHIHTPDEFAAIRDSIAPQAVETCRNWFFKIASIRELLPRIYIEIALLPCYRFVQAQSFERILRRLTHTIRGVGDPLVATYVAAYLARVSLHVLPLDRAHLTISISDFLVNQRRMALPEFDEHVKSHGVDRATYLGLYAPALAWLLHRAAHCGSAHEASRLTALVAEEPAAKANGLLWSCLLSAMSPDVVAANALELAGYIEEADALTFPKHQLWATLGVNLLLCAPPADKRIAILERVWANVTKIAEPDNYVVVAETWIEFPLNYLTTREVDVMLADVLAHVNVDRAHERLQPRLVGIVQKVLAKHSDFEALFAMQHFLPLLDLFQGEAKVDASKSLVAAFNRVPPPVSDAVVISSMVSICKTVHDSLNALSFADEARRVRIALCQFVRQCDFDRDVERQLNFLNECRASLGNIDAVKETLVQRAAELCMRTRALVKGKHTRKTAAFVRACIAFMFVTIPAMDADLPRLRLYRLAAEVALLNNALPQCDALLKSAIALVATVPPQVELPDGRSVSSEAELVDIISTYCALLVAVPGDPESGPFYLFRGLLGAVHQYPWAKSSTAPSTIYVRALAALGALGQSPLPYCAPDVIGNDRLYAGASEYVKQLQESCDSLLEQLLGAIAAAKDNNDAVRQCQLATELFGAMSSRCRLTPKSATLLLSLGQMAASISKREKLASEGKLFRKHARALASGAVIGRDSSSIDAASDEDVLRVSRELYRRLKDAIDSDETPTGPTATTTAAAEKPSKSKK